MDTTHKSHTKCIDKYNKGSLLVFVILLVLAVLLFAKVEVVNRKAEAIEAKLEKRIQRIDDEMKTKVQRMFEDYLQSNMITATTESRDRDRVILGTSKTLETISDHRHRERRNANPTSSTVSLQQIRQEIDKKLTQACTNTNKLCQAGPQGPPGDPGAPGYPGYKGEKGVQGKPGPRGPLGRTGVHGARGKQGPKGSQEDKGEKGDKGSIGSPGNKGDLGPMGKPGHKGSTGLKGSKGNRGSIGIQGPKGECVVSPKIILFPESLDVFLNKEATFYCWVQGATSKKITWSKLGSTLLDITATQSGVLHIRNVTRAHAGSYMCTAYTSHGILKAFCSLDVKEPPIFILKPPSTILVEQGFVVNLCCEAAGSPQPKIEWSRPQSSSNSLLRFQGNGCLKIDAVKEKIGSYSCRATNAYGVTQTTTTVIVSDSCDIILSRHPKRTSGINELKINTEKFQVFCDMAAEGKGWTLIARFSNNDGKNWMKDNGLWWYDQQVTVGATTNPSINADMISPAFWLVRGRELKITRSDDSSHTPLLQTTGNCLAGQTFRSKITSYGNFRNGKVWSSDRCLGSCTVQYGGQYKSTDGFQQAECSGGIQSNKKIGFWCDWDQGDGSVMMIGGGGSECNRADHGIGITEANEASFDHGGREYDFGYDSPASQSYSLNLWIR